MMIRIPICLLALLLLSDWGCSRGVYERGKRDVWEVGPNQYISRKNQATLSWEYQRPSCIFGFEIERRKEPEKQFKKIAEVGPDETRYTDSGLMPDAIYYYRVRAYNSALKSEYTEEVKLKILGDEYD